MWEVGLPPSPVEFSSHRHFHKLSCCWLLDGAAAPASLHVCLQLTWEVGLPSSPVEFSSLHHCHMLSRSWLLSTHTRLPPEPLWPAWLVYLQSPNLRCSLHPTLFWHVLIVLIAYWSVSLFSRVEVGLSRGLCCSGPGLSAGVPRYREAHLVCVFPSHLGTGDWRPGGPPGFSV
jgi:hypothetical protein